MEIQNLSQNVLLHVQSQRPFKRVSFLNTPYSEVFKPRFPGDDAAAVEIRHPGRPEKPIVQQGDSAASGSIALASLRDMPAEALLSQEGLAPERVLHLLN